MVKKTPSYCTEFEDFMSKAEKLLNDKDSQPTHPARFTTKMRGCIDTLELKITNNKKVSYHEARADSDSIFALFQIYKYKIAGVSKSEEAMDQLRLATE